jgi:hypothetical protein
MKTFFTSIFILFSIVQIQAGDTKNSPQHIVIDSVNASITQKVILDSSFRDNFQISVTEFPIVEKDSLEKVITKHEASLKKYQDENKSWTLHHYPLLTIISASIAIIVAFLTMLIQGHRARIERLRLNQRWEHEVNERQREKLETIATLEKERVNQIIEEKIKRDSNTLSIIMEYVEKEKGTVTMATFLAMSIKSSLIIEGYPDYFQNISDGYKRILINFFALDAQFYSKPHHAHFHNQLLMNIPEFVSRTTEMTDPEYTQILQRYELALTKVMQSEISTFYSSWINYLEHGESVYTDLVRAQPQLTLLATTLITNLQLIHDSFDVGNIKRNGIRVITTEAYTNNHLYRRLILRESLN